MREVPTGHLFTIQVPNDAKAEELKAVLDWHGFEFTDEETIASGI